MNLIIKLKDFLSQGNHIISPRSFWDVNLINNLKEGFIVLREVKWDLPLTFSDKSIKHFELRKDKLRKYRCNWFKIQPRIKPDIDGSSLSNSPSTPILQEQREVSNFLPNVGTAKGDFGLQMLESLKYQALNQFSQLEDVEKLVTPLLMPRPPSFLGRQRTSQ